MRKFTYLAATIAFTQAVAFALPAHSAGFQNSLSSTTGTGRAFAGSGVSGDSISDMAVNPASLTLRQGREVEFGISLVSPSSQFTNSGSSTTYAGVLTLPTSGADSNGGTDVMVPNFFYSAPINDSWSYGIGITSPFGLTTEYDSTWVGRYQAQSSELTTLEITPAVAYRINPMMSVGFGISLVKAEAKLSRAQFTGLGSADGVSSLEGDDTGIGWGAGIIVGDDQGKFGLSYRSETQLEPSGELIISPLGIRAGAQTQVTLPRTMYVSGMKVVSDRVDLLSSWRHTDWNSFNELRFEFDNGLPDDVTPQNWKSSSTYSIGINFRQNDRWTYRGGLGYDDSPVSDQYRTARIPDNDRKWLSLGLSYKTAGNVRFDLSYAHIVSKEASLNETKDLVSTTPGAAVSNLSGSYNSNGADVLSFSVSIPLGN